jgi:hypothetical protein
MLGFYPVPSSSKAFGMGLEVSDCARNSIQTSLFGLKVSYRNLVNTNVPVHEHPHHCYYMLRALQGRILPIIPEALTNNSTTSSTPLCLRTGLGPSRSPPSCPPRLPPLPCP